MRKLKFAGVCLLAVIAISNAAYAKAPGFSTPKKFPEGIYIQPSASNAFVPTPMPRGVDNYPAFANVPNFGSFAKVLEENIRDFESPPKDFYYIDNINQLFTYSSKIYDYFKTDAVKISEYKRYLERIGFSYSRDIAELISPDYPFDYPTDYQAYVENPQYIELIREDIMYDPVFKMDMTGVYWIETNYGYTIVVFGDYINYNGGMEPEPCKEIRLYNLFYDQDIMGNIMKYVESFQNNIDARTFYLYVPERNAYTVVSSDTIFSFVNQNDPSGYINNTSDESVDDYMRRLLDYLGI